MIGIKQMYNVNHKVASCGVQGYAIEKKYEQSSKNDKLSKEEQKKRLSKRGHYLEDYAKAHGDNPGPGDYNQPNSNWSSQNKLSTRKIKPTKKMTFIDQIFKKQKTQNLPAPGQYKLFKDERDIKAEKKRLANKKVNHTQRMNYLDGVQYQASITPGVGSYNTNIQRPKSATMIRKPKTSLTSRPLSNLKKKEKRPSIGSYDPKYMEDHKSFVKKKKGYNQWGRVQRFSSNKSGSNLGPGAYLKGDEDKVVGRKGIKSIYY